jgi:hypothetical protein
MNAGISNRMNAGKKDKSETENKKPKEKIKIPADNSHLGSSNAFEETENPLSRDPDDISDEKLDELISE